MYSQDFTHYRRPDTRNVTWLTPQQMDAIRLEAAVGCRAPVKVRELPPQARPTSDDNAAAQNILTLAPQIVAAATRSGLVLGTNRGAAPEGLIIRGKTGMHRHGWSAARRARYIAKRKGTKYNKTNLKKS